MATKNKTVAELRSELEGLGEKIGDLRSKERTDEVRAELHTTVEEVNFLDHQLKAAVRTAELDASDGPEAGTRGAEQRDDRTAGVRVIESDEYKEFAARGARGTAELEVRTLLSTTASSGLLMPAGTPQFHGVSRQRLFLRDVINVSPTTLNSVPYLRELNAATNELGATAVAEGTAKPEVVMEFVDEDAPIRKIAAWIPVTSEQLADAPQLRSYIDGRLRYMLALREERQLLSGGGVSPNIKGILNYTVQTQSAVAGDFPAAIGLSIGKIETVGGVADAVVMSAANYWSMVTSRHDEAFDGASAGPNPFGAPVRQVWGVPVITSAALTANHALVGSFGLGATLLDRESAVIRVGEQHASYFVENKVAVLAEERVGLAMHREDYFVDATLA